MVTERLSLSLDIKWACLAVNLQGGFEPTTSDFSTSPHTELPRQTEGEAQNPFSSAEVPPATPQGREQLGEGGGGLCFKQAGRRLRSWERERMVDLRKLRGKLGKLWSWQGVQSWEGGGVRGICVFLAGCLREGVHGTSQPSFRNRERPSGGHRVMAGTHLPGRYLWDIQVEMLPHAPLDLPSLSHPPTSPGPSQQSHCFLKNPRFPRPFAHLLQSVPPLERQDSPPTRSCWPLSSSECRMEFPKLSPDTGM